MITDDGNQTHQLGDSQDKYNYPPNACLSIFAILFQILVFLPPKTTPELQYEEQDK